MAGLPTNAGLFNIYCKSRTNLFLAANGNEVILTKANSSDEFQQWYKFGNPDGSFAVVNKHDYTAMKQVPVHKTVELTPYENFIDESIQWIEKKDNDTDGYSNIKIPGEKTSAWDVNGGKVEEGARLGIEYAVDNPPPTQRWKFASLSDCSRRPGEEKTTE